MLTIFILNETKKMNFYFVIFILGRKLNKNKLNSLNETKWGNNEKNKKELKDK